MAEGLQLRATSGLGNLHLKGCNRVIVGLLRRHIRLPKGR